MHVSSSVCKFIMATFGFLVIAAVTAGLVIGLSGQEVQRSFTVDHEANTFLMNGEPFRYISGSFHYFRALPGAWRERLRTMRASGLNAVDTYVEWALHNPNDGVYNWDGLANLEQFIEMVQEEGFFIILRPGPYICAERDNGGLPHWLFNKYPDIKMRTNDSNYTREVSLWYSQMMPRMQKYLYGNGGPIIMVQVENEYGSFHACDKDYLNWLRDETERYVQGQAVLFTTDIPNERIACGKIENVFATTDFGIDRIHEIDDIWNILRTVQPTGPLVNSEFYPGWLTHWQEENQRRDPNEVASALRKILEYGASVNIYMFFGGTNFGFTAGANDFGSNDYTADITSYDYDAVMDEQGDTTTKYELVRDVISNYLNVSKDISTPTKSLKIAYGKVEMKPLVTLMSAVGREILSPGNPIVSEKPKTFEELNQFSGLVLYETILPTLEIDPTLMTVGELRDRAYIFVDQFLVGTLSRENNIKKIPLNSGLGVKLQLLVENQGRINYNIANDTKGILGDVTIQKLDGNQTVLRNWNSTSFSLKDEHIESLIKKYKNSEFVTEKDAISSRNILSQGPVIHYGEFTVSEIADSFLNTENWGKGVAYLNGFNLGRYWPLVGPQLTLYAPKELMQIGTNTLVLIEYQRVADISNDGTSDIYFDASPKLDGFK